MSVKSRIALAGFALAAALGYWKFRPVSLTRAQLDHYCGRFQDPQEPAATLSIYREDDHLLVETERLPPVRLKPRSHTTFQAIRGPLGRFEFGLNANENSVTLSTELESGGRHFRRVGEPVRHSFPSYTQTEAMIAMRDGVKLHIAIVRPEHQTAPLPILFERTPYNATLPTPMTLYVARSELARSGYIFVRQDIRGRYKSEGHYVTLRPPADPLHPKQTDETTDAYDSIEWLLHNIPGNNGRVGLLGASYSGLLVLDAAIHLHPAVRAISPQAPMVNVWMADDWFHNGAFRQTVGFDFAVYMESGKQIRKWGSPDLYDAFLRLGSFGNLRRAAPDPNIPLLTAFAQHPDYDSYWQVRAVEPRLTKLSVPTLNVGGYYDPEDMWGPQGVYAAYEPFDAGNKNFLVLGPWTHEQWRSSTQHLGQLHWAQPTGDYFRQQIEAPFFARYLKDESGFDIADTISFQAGSNTWKQYSRWPPDSQPANLYLQSSGALSFEEPVDSDERGVRSYISDPNQPVPYTARPIPAFTANPNRYRNWLADDQSFASRRADVLTWQTQPLTHDLTLTGDVIANLFASTSGTDADWVVKLIDVSPQGFEWMTNGEIFRGRYRQSFSQPCPIAANSVEHYKWSLHAVDHVFQAGHRLMVTVQSSWFPLYDRNPQKFIPNIMLAQPQDFQSATQRIYASQMHPSHLILPVVTPPVVSEPGLHASHAVRERQSPEPRSAAPTL